VSTVHTSVLLEEVLDDLSVQPGGVFVDGTLGGGGHTRALLEASAPDGRVLGIDQDPEALDRTRSFLAPFGERFQSVHGNFGEILDLAREAGFDQPDGVLLDLGVSSDQLDTPERGFSFRFDGPLDMRMNPEAGEALSDWLSGVEESTLAQVLWTWGEERQSRRIARAILEACDAGQLTGTEALASVVERAVGGRKGARIHPATKTFQALRMAVNREMEVLKQGLEGALELVKPGGRVAVISFHSLEDREVKQTFRRHEGREVSLYEGGSRWEGEDPRVRSVHRKPRVAEEAERGENPRARSAKLRTVQRLETS